MVSVPLVLAAVVAHELGHLAAARALGWSGRLGMVTRPFPYPVARIVVPALAGRWALCLVASAGPLASVTFGAAVWSLSPLAGSCSVLLGVLSLVPAPRQDGAHVWKALRS